MAYDEKRAARIRKAQDGALRDPNTRIFDITGRPMKGWILVEPRGVAGTKLRPWVEKARRFVKTLPAK